MMSTTSGTVTEFNERGFRIAGKNGRETQIAAGAHQYERLLKIGDEVQVYGGSGGGGSSGQDRIFLSSYISVLRAGEWVRTEELKKRSNIKLGILAVGLIFGFLTLLIIILTAAIVMWFRWGAN